MFWDLWRSFSDRGTVYAISKRELLVVERCPHCNCRDIGKIGNNQFYCWNCFMEFAVVGEEVKIYCVDEDGSLVAWNPDVLADDAAAAV